MEGFLEQLSESDSPKSDPRGSVAKPSTQIHIHHCPEYESAKVQTSKGELEIGKQEFERLQCDCQISSPGQRNKTSIAPSIRRQQQLIEYEIVQPATA